MDEEDKIINYILNMMQYDSNTLFFTATLIEKNDDNKLELLQKSKQLSDSVDIFKKYYEKAKEKFNK